MVCLLLAMSFYSRYSYLGIINFHRNPENLYDTAINNFLFEMFISNLPYHVNITNSLFTKFIEFDLSIHIYSILIIMAIFENIAIY